MKETNIQITVGIPMYNAELYITDTLYSVMKGIDNKIEILIVNDCSTDNSENIVNNIKNSHDYGEMIRVINQSINKGVAEARNTIIREAKGKYLFFMDADDIISEGTLSTFLSYAEKYQAEAVFGSFLISKGNKIEIFRKLPDLVLIGEDKLASFFYNDIKENILCSVCNILLLRSFILGNNLFFPDTNYGEDLLFDYRMFPLINRAVLSSCLTYTYITHPNSLSNYQSRHSIDIQEAKRALEISKQIKKTILGLEVKDYFPYKCAKDMKQILYFICGIIKHRDLFNKKISDKEICSVMKHPVPLFRILKFKKQRNINLFFYFIGILPTRISIKTIELIGRSKGFI